MDEVVDESRGFADEVAERMRALQTTPDGRPGTVDATRRVGDLPAGEQHVHTVLLSMSEFLITAVQGIRAVHDGVDAEDPTSADLLHATIGSFEQKAWMLRSESLER